MSFRVYPRLRLPPKQVDIASIGIFANVPFDIISVVYSKIAYADVIMWSLVNKSFYEMFIEYNSRNVGANVRFMLLINTACENNYYDMIKCTKFCMSNITHYIHAMNILEISLKTNDMRMYNSICNKFENSYRYRRDLRRIISESNICDVQLAIFNALPTNGGQLIHLVAQVIFNCKYGTWRTTKFYNMKYSSRMIRSIARAYANIYGYENDCTLLEIIEKYTVKL